MNKFAKLERRLRIYAGGEPSLFEIANANLEKNGKNPDPNVVGMCMDGIIELFNNVKKEQLPMEHIISQLKSMANFYSNYSNNKYQQMDTDVVTNNWCLALVQNVLKYMQERINNGKLDLAPGWGSESRSRIYDDYKDTGIDLEYPERYGEYPELESYDNTINFEARRRNISKSGV